MLYASEKTKKAHKHKQVKPKKQNEANQKGSFPNLPQTEKE